MHSLLKRKLTKVFAILARVKKTKTPHPDDRSRGDCGNCVVPDDCGNRGDCVVTRDCGDSGNGGNSGNRGDCSNCSDWWLCVVIIAHLLHPPMVNTTQHSHDCALFPHSQLTNIHMSRFLPLSLHFLVNAVQFVQVFEVDKFSLLRTILHWKSLFLVSICLPCVLCLCSDSSASRRVGSSVSQLNERGTLFNRPEGPSSVLKRSSVPPGFQFGSGREFPHSQQNVTASLSSNGSVEQEVSSALANRLAREREANFKLKQKVCETI